MRLLILGGAGMLGHQLWRYFRDKHEVWVSLRKPFSYYANTGLFDKSRTIGGVDVSCQESLVTLFRMARPEVAINCVGIVKQLKEARNPLLSLSINSVLPHRLSDLCAVAGARLIHMSTDCVFSGRRGGYLETDVGDAEDLYGRTKFLGEVNEQHCLTLRSSIIGRELETRSGLIEWFLNQEGNTINGFRKAIYSGFTTLEMARIIDIVLKQHMDIHGVWQVSSARINKYELLRIASKAFGWRGEIIPDDSFVCDRSLDSSRFKMKTGYQPPVWEAMIEELAAESR